MQTVRIGDYCTGHGCYPSRKAETGSSNVFFNNIQVVRVNDLWEQHCCGDCHSGKQEIGSPNFKVNGLNVARVGDKIDCGSYAKTGSSNVGAN